MRDEVENVHPYHPSSSLATTLSTSSKAACSKQIKDEQNASKLFSKEELLNYEEEIPSEDIDNFKNTTPWESSNAIIENKIIVEGSNWFKQQFDNLYNKYSYIFVSSLDGEPANLPPMKLNVDESKWCKPINSTSPRPQSRLKCEEIKKQIDKLSSGSHPKIRKSTQAYTSQVHLARKPHSDPPAYRMCIDYRNLNDATYTIKWTIPLIEEMLRRIGDKKPKYFATLDLTAGYHQIRMDSDSVKYTAFITFLGIYEWLCIPFGLKGAPAYFQKLMATEVLSGLIYDILELYIDDIIIFAQSEKELLERIELVFERCCKFNIKLSPAKCKFGLKRIEFVGRVLDEQGISISEKKKEFVVNFLRPSNQKQMKSFLGLINHFGAHVPNISIITQPLRTMIEPYHPHKILNWTEQQKMVFESIKRIFNNIPT